MELLKSLDELTKMDEKHRLMGAVCGGVPSLKRCTICYHKSV